MDPKETLDLINDPFYGPGDRSHAVGDLAEWIAKGGAVPHDAGNISDGTMDDLGDDRALIAAIRVAIEYGDLSGLEGLGYEVKR